MDRRRFIRALAGGVLAAPLATQAQQQRGKVYRVGYLGLGARRDALADSLLRALRDLGYVEGQNRSWSSAGRRAAPCGYLTWPTNSPRDERSGGQPCAPRR